MTTLNKYIANKRDYLWLQSNNSVLIGGNDTLSSEFSSSDISSGDVSTDSSTDQEKELTESRMVASICTPLMKYLQDEKQKPVNYVGAIPIKINYMENADAKIITNNCHMGQRKLLLTEIEFYVRCIKDFDATNNLVIYAGSAPCEHLPVILNLFKNIKFLLIDPNYHSIDANYQYVYQNNSIIDKKNYRHFMSYLQRPQSGRMRQLNRITKKMTSVKFLSDISEKDENTYNIFDKSDEYYTKMKKLENVFYESDEFKLIDDIMNNEDRVFIIQDYLTPKMINRLRNHYDKSLTKPNIYFVTDIRTALVGGPYDVDLLWNCALQTIFLKVIQPEYSMLKYRQPFFDRITKDIFQNKHKYSRLSMVYDDFDYVKKEYGEDFIGRHFNGEFYYFDDSEILVQPWAPKGSSETRLYLSKKQINRPFIKIDYKTFEDKMYAFRFIREYKYFPIYYPIIKNYQENEWDGCQDCAREIYICGSYLLVYPKTYGKDIQEETIAERLSDEKFFNKILDIYRMINEHTHYDLSKHNYKCPLHVIKPLTKQKSDINMLTTNFSTRTTTTFNVGIDGIISKTERPQTREDTNNAE
jgi:hypothetical protein